jgi:hypothetical protein
MPFSPLERQPQRSTQIGLTVTEMIPSPHDRARHFNFALDRERCPTDLPQHTPNDDAVTKHRDHRGQLPAPATADDSLQVLTEAIDNLARQRTPYWLSDCTPWPASSPRPSNSCPKLSATPATKN